jgi:hypothetical protein
MTRSSGSSSSRVHGGYDADDAADNNDDNLE